MIPLKLCLKNDLVPVIFKSHYDSFRYTGTSTTTFRLGSVKFLVPVSSQNLYRRVYSVSQGARMGSQMVHPMAANI